MPGGERDAMRRARALANESSITSSRGRDTGSAQTGHRGSRLYGAMRLEPYQQGELDYFCGVYAIINALRLSLETVSPLSAAQATELLKHGLVYLDERGRMPLCKRSGLSVGSWHRLAAELARKAGQGAAVSIKPWRLFRTRQHVSLREVLEAVEMMIDEGSPVLLLLQATNRHFTVVSGYSPSGFGCLTAVASLGSTEHPATPSAARIRSTRSTQRRFSHFGCSDPPSPTTRASARPSRGAIMITVEEFCRIEAAVRAAGYAASIEWSETAGPPISADQFAREAIYVICNSGMRNSIARGIFDRCMAALDSERSATTVFGHRGKAAAIDAIWAERDRHFAEYLAAPDPVAYCGTLPWLGPITKYHLAKNFGGNFAKPDVHLKRLADAENTTPQELCERLAAATGYRASTIDLILWRACADGIINSREFAPPEA